MMHRSTWNGLLLVALLGLGCGLIASAAEESSAPQQAVAVVRGTQGHRGVRGIVTFTEKDGKVVVEARFRGLTPSSKQAIHIHQFGDLRAADGTGTGGHYNPEGNPHGLPPNPKRHAGDLGNLTVDADGNGTLNLTVDNITIAGAKNPIIGHAIIVHAKEDDGGQPTGNAGARVAQGVIGIANPKAPGS